MSTLHINDHDLNINSKPYGGNLFWANIALDGLNILKTCQHLVKYIFNVTELILGLRPQLNCYCNKCIVNTIYMQPISI